MEMLPLAPSQDDTDWIITALCALNPEAAADPQVRQRLARTESIKSVRARARAGSLSWSEAVAALEDKETIAEAADALVAMGAQARHAVPALQSRLGTWRDYFIFKVLRAVQPEAIMDALRLPACAGEAAAALGELGPDARWALPALHLALDDAPPESAGLITSALAAIEAPEVPPCADSAAPLTP